jgi:nucleotide-binding universal stress UspA family protein
MKRPSTTKPKAAKATCGHRGAAVTFKRILVTTDFSPSSARALEYAAALAAPFDAAVTLLHIAEAGSIGYEHGTPDFPRMESQLRIAAKKQIAECLKRNVAVEIKVGRGGPFGGKRAYHEIVETARKERADLIVISTHGYSGLDRLIMGSTAERVVRHAPCPVLVVRAREHEGTRARSPRRGEPEAWPYLLP